MQAELFVEGAQGGFASAGLAMHRCEACPERRIFRAFGAQAGQPRKPGVGSELRARDRSALLEQGAALLSVDAFRLGREAFEDRGPSLEVDQSRAQGAAGVEPRRVESQGLAQIRDRALVGVGTRAGEQSPPRETDGAHLARERKSEGAVEQRARALGVVDVMREGEREIEGLAVVRDVFEDPFEMGEGERRFARVRAIEARQAQAQGELALRRSEGEPGFEQLDQGLAFPLVFVDAGERVLDEGVAGGLEQRGPVALRRLVEITEALRHFSESHAPGQPFAFAREPLDHLAAERRELPVRLGAARPREDLRERLGDFGHGPSRCADRLEQPARACVVAEIAAGDACEA